MNYAVHKNDLICRQIQRVMNPCRIIWQLHRGQKCSAAILAKENIMFPNPTLWNTVNLLHLLWGH